MSGRALKSLGWTALVAVFAVFIYLPVAVLVIYSFHAGRVPVPPFEGPTLDWYGKVLSDGKLLAGARHSVAVGVISSAVATLLGLLAAHGFARHRVPGKALLQGLIVLPLTVSYLVIGLGLLICLGQLGLSKSLVVVGVGHVVINLPLCFLIALSQMGPAEAKLEAAARDLGASEWDVIVKVALPLALPSLFAAFFSPSPSPGTSS